MAITVEWTIVAEGNAQTADSASGVIPGLPVERVQLLRRDRTTTNIALPTARSTDARMQTVFGDKIIDARAKQRVIAMDGLLTFEQYRKLSQFREDSRAVYLSPNFDERTFLSVPLFGSQKSIAGPQLTTSDEDERFAWDSDAKVVRSFTIDGDVTTVGGPFGRYGRPNRSAAANKLTKAHPDTTSTGWTLASGTGVVTHGPNYPSVVLARRNSATIKGVTNLDCGTTTAPKFETPATGLTSGVAIGAVAYVMSPRSCSVDLLKADGTVSNSAATAALPGVWQRIELQGAQSTAGTTAKIQIEGDGSTGGGYLIRVSACYLGNVATDDVVPDWVDGSESAYKLDGAGAGIGHSFDAGSLTLTALMQLPQAGSTMGGIGVMRMGSSGGYLRYNVSAAELQFDPTGSDPVTCQPFVDLAGTPQAVSAGEFIHIVCTSTRTERAIWVKGVKIGTDATTLDGGIVDGTKRLGYGGSSLYDCSSNTGMCLLRMDHGAWSDLEIQRHYQTFGQTIGQAIVAQVYGRKFEITELSAEQFSMDKDDTLFRCDITLEQVDAGLDFSPVRRTEAWA